EEDGAESDESGDDDASAGADDDAASGADDDAASGTTDDADDEAAGSSDEDVVATPISAAPLSPAEAAELLEAIIEYHVAEGTHRESELLTQSSLDTLEGTALTLSTREEPPASDDGEPTTVLTVDGVDVSASDLLATNGVIHTVDSVLVPADHAEDLERLVASIPVATDAFSTLQGTGEHTQLVAALEAAGLADEIGALASVTVFAPTDSAFDRLSPAEQALLDDPEI